MYRKTWAREKIIYIQLQAAEDLLEKNDILCVFKFSDRHWGIDTFILLHFTSIRFGSVQYKYILTVTASVLYIAVHPAGLTDCTPRV